MSKTYFNFGSGWYKEGDKLVISAVANKKANDQYNEVTIVAKNAAGEEVPIESFAVFVNQNKTADNHPDVRFTFSIGE